MNKKIIFKIKVKGFVNCQSKECLTLFRYNLKEHSILINLSRIQCSRKQTLCGLNMVPTQRETMITTGTKNETKSRSDGTISYKSLYFVKPSLELEPLFTGR